MFKAGDQFKTLAEAKEAIKAAILDSDNTQLDTDPLNVSRGVKSRMA